jgi:hypothetical protein
MPGGATTLPGFRRARFDLLSRFRAQRSLASERRPRRQTAADLAQLVANAASAKGDGPRGFSLSQSRKRA